MIKRLLLTLTLLPFLMGAADFDGYTDQINYTNIYDPSSTATTVSMWVYPDDVSASARYYFSIDDGGGTRNWTILTLGGVTGQLQFQVIGSTALIRKSNTSSIAASSWQHLLIRGDGSVTAGNYEIFVDGTEVGYALTTNGVSLTASTGTWVLGSRTSDDAINYDGRIANVGVWDRELSDAEVAILAEGYDPECIPRNLVFSPPLIREVIDPISGQSGTNDGTTVIAHPRILHCE